MKLSAGTALGLLSGAAALDASQVLWYNQSATRDFFDALPIGNGRLGAMMNGYTDQELIRLNEETVWSGGFIKNNIPPRALENLDPLRQQILAGNLTEATETWEDNFAPPWDNMRRYQPAGELRLDFPHPPNSTTKYTRSLDLSTGLFEASYVYDGVTYTREAFGNFPSNVLGFKLAASKHGALTFNMGLTRDYNVTKLTAQKNKMSIILHGTGQETNTDHYASELRLVVTGSGKVTSNGTALEVKGANEAWILYTAETAYRHPGSNVNALQKIVDERLDAAIALGYSKLRNDGVKDYQQYYSRVSVDLGDSGSLGQQDMATRLLNYKKGSNITTDPAMMTLQFNYGRYLLIQSSRPGTLPANLQGIWNKDFVPPWDSKFTLNINLEMNYWLAQPMDLSEIAEPVVDFLDMLSKTGADVAKGMYDADGWCCHHNSDAAGDCMPYHRITPAAPFPLGGAWVAFEAIERWRFTGDKDFSRDRIMPLLRGILTFIYSWAQEHEGWMITNPCCSPENAYYIPEGDTMAGNNTGIDAGSMCDRAIMWEVMTGFIDISEDLGLTDGVERARNFRSKIQGPVAGSYGQLLEWSQEFPETDPGMRHLSPLVGVQPGSMTSPLLQPEDALKAYILLRHRMDNGGGGTSWAVVWASVQHARQFDAPHAIDLAVQLVADWTWPTLLSRNGGYYQIDGNLGFVSAVTEMLLQSHAGVVHLGPAIPDYGMDTGSFKGWMARGGFKVDMTWANGTVTGASIKSLLGNPLNVRVANGTTIKVNGSEMKPQLTGGVETKAGQTYIITV